MSNWTPWAIAWDRFNLCALANASICFSNPISMLTATVLEPRPILGRPAAPGPTDPDEMDRRGEEKN
jgi:hypothetical protein